MMKNNRAPRVALTLVEFFDVNDLRLYKQQRQLATVNPSFPIISYTALLPVAASFVNNIECEQKEIITK